MLEAINLKKNFGDHQALKGINMTVNAGEIFCLLGANGAGKTTTINIFLNFIKPTEGQVLVDGEPMEKNIKLARKKMVYIPENLMLYPHLSGVENLDFFLRIGGISLNKENLEQQLISSGLQDNFIHRSVSTYSKGMRQKVGIALAKSKNASILLLDEPTSGLDPKASNEFHDLLLKMKEDGVSTLMATHDLFRAKSTGTHIGIMKNGEMVKTLESHEIDYQDLEQLYLEEMVRLD
ncbi:ABC transporter ATP-binding protein [Aureibacter tunicatorum]|uniref:ABC-2 type transport system ATP-binding protein n=1 Tax=Aureibacter tunicatorum TaxID=866807 RepID=A0AAE3XUB2_9BACT|nr:ABC transporter ATP-binding protein [Aureibacter tunicatorum]MDR6242026.1 ABC-2 type transport system ATP-binding protein [Aureibacter tunicatorum]BDD07129.1 ABC transporter ATP-binding protein [Aureibacter tunicatorum]